VHKYTWASAEVSSGSGRSGQW